MRNAIGIDLGGTKLDVALVDDAGKILARHKSSTNIEGGAYVIMDEIISVVQTLQKDSQTSVESVGVGIAGQIESETGKVFFAPNLHWKDIPLQSYLSSALKLPVAVINDVRAATMGEWLYGAGKDCPDLICLFIGTGIGGGIINNGKMLTGANNSAGEVGHMTIDLHGPVCTCGNIGCLEALAGGWALAKKAKEIIASNADVGKYIFTLADKELENVSTLLIFQAFREGDPLAISIIEEAEDALVAGVVSLVNAFNPSKFILGGGILQGYPELIDHLKIKVKARALKAACSRLEFLHASLNTDAGVIGAALFAMKGRT